jgi:hypothetical protein
MSNARNTHTSIRRTGRNHLGDQRTKEEDDIKINDKEIGV